MVYYNKKYYVRYTQRRMIPMRNYWFIPRPKRKLIPVPEIFSAFIAGSLHSEWSGEVGKHLSFEEELEKQGLKRKGDRRDQGGSGGRTYGSWLFSLGLYFEKKDRKSTRLNSSHVAISY